MVDGDIGMLPYLAMKQKLEIVESNNIVRGFCWVTRPIEE